MIIRSVAASLPSRRVCNDDVIEMIREQSRNFQGDLTHALRVVRKFLVGSGLQERRWCGRHESPIDHVSFACERALAETYLQPRQIDLLVYVGIGRGFMEPGNSHMIADALGFSHAQCFDIVDACMSWVRALQLVDGLFKSGGYRNALVINAEFNMSGGSYLASNSFELQNADQIPYTFPVYTIGEAATATLLLPEESDNFEFVFSSSTEFSDLCTIPVAGYKGYSHPSDKLGKRGVLQFTSFGMDLHESGRGKAVDVFNEVKNKQDVDIVFVHASSKKEWDGYADQVGVKDKVFHIYPNTGNLVSASIPAAMYDARENNRFSKGENAIAWVGSAGMSFNATKFRF